MEHEFVTAVCHAIFLQLIEKEGGKRHIIDNNKWIRLFEKGTFFVALSSSERTLQEQKMLYRIGIYVTDGVIVKNASEVLYLLMAKTIRHEGTTK